MIHSLVVDTRPYQWMDAGSRCDGGAGLEQAVFMASEGACWSEM